jgi:hypothetical protein
VELDHTSMEGKVTRSLIQMGSLLLPSMRSIRRD